ncbi:C40 family peptidase [Nonomuraea gerenzanensis]|uniref:NLP/P60 family protein n=1 Tax=Nonomuraea gerenzanensis TaxID=93944 RepID=A0A1M4DYS9_9ACTN|nr:NlpC/P60 family protein [Nonomuraea gerenzanensis]UBU14027.1 NlpC/P60 family protein [Nonomuraea gerenzanensis]SBO91713.1 NLP/P60 family protein [Nonomuraea gerenzanensis]
MRRRLALAAVLLLLTATASVPLGLSMPPLIVRIAYELEQRDIVYSWGGGHAAAPGPSKGTCRGYRGRIKPCPAARTRGLDCSGFARWVYALAHGQDVLGPGNTDDHVRRMRRVSSPRPGDLVFFGKITKRSVRTHHVGVYLGGGKMMNAPETGAVVRVDEIGRKKGFAGFYRY